MLEIAILELPIYFLVMIVVLTLQFDVDYATLLAHILIAIHISAHLVGGQYACIELVITLLQVSIVIMCLIQIVIVGGRELSVDE